MRSNLRALKGAKGNRPARCKMSDLAIIVQSKPVNVASGEFIRYEMHLPSPVECICRPIPGPMGAIGARLDDVDVLSCLGPLPPLFARLALSESLGYDGIN